MVDVEARMVEQWRRDRETPIAVRDCLVWQPAPARSALEIDLPKFFTGVISRLRRP